MTVWSPVTAASGQILVVYLFFACLRFFLCHEALSTILRHRLNDFSNRNSADKRPNVQIRCLIGSAPAIQNLGHACRKTSVNHASLLRYSVSWPFFWNQSVTWYPLSSSFAVVSKLKSPCKIGESYFVPDRYQNPFKPNRSISETVSLPTNNSFFLYRPMKCRYCLVLIR